MYTFKNDYGQLITFQGSKIKLVATVDAIKAMEYVQGCDGTIGLGNLIDIHIKSVNDVFFIKVI